MAGATVTSGTVRTSPLTLSNGGAVIVETGSLILPAGNADAIGLLGAGVWNVTIAGSVYTDGVGLFLAAGNASASTITITADGSLRGLAGGIWIGNSAGQASSPATVNNAGAISGDITFFTVGAHTVNNTGTLIGNITSGAGTDTVTNSGVMGAALLEGGTNSFTNSGGAVGSSSAISFNGADGGDVVKNLLGGTFAGAVLAGAGTNSLVNEGQIGALAEESYIGGTGADTVTNTGVLAGAVNAGTGGGTLLLPNVNKLTNSGTIGANASLYSYVGGDGSDTVINTSPGSLAGGLFMGEGANVLTNSGAIGNNGFYGYRGGNGADTVTNSGSVTGVIFLYAGTNILANTGTIGRVDGGGGADTVTNTSTASATAYIENVDLVDGINTFTNTGARVGSGGLYNDSYAGGYTGTDTVINANLGALRGVLEGGVVFNHGDNTLTNAGDIGTLTNIYLGLSVAGKSGKDTVTNSAKATMAGGIDLGSGTNTLTNAGSIGADSSGLSYIGAEGTDTVTNTSPGSLAGGLDMGAGTNVLTNTGSIGKSSSNISYVGTAGADTITNTAPGVLGGNLQVGDGTNKLVNSGTVSGYYYGGTEIDGITNSGRLGGVDMGGGTNTLANTGFIGSYVTGEGGNDIVTNTSTAAGTASILGDVNLGAGANSFTNTGGTVGTGGDSQSYLGGINNDTVINANFGTVRGMLSGVVLLDDGDNTLTNAGDIRATAGGPYSLLSVTGGSGKDTITNSAKATMEGGMDVGSGTNVLNNTGSIGADGAGYSYQGAGGADTVVNTSPGSLAGGVAVGSGTNVLTNSGSIGKMFLGWSYISNGTPSGNDTITNALGATLSGGVDAGRAGVNLLTNLGSIGADNDGYSYRGGENADTVSNSGTMSGGVILAYGLEFVSPLSINTLTNSGTIGVAGNGFSYTGGNLADTVTNSGVLAGGIDLGNAQTGFIAGSPPVTFLTENKLTNTATGKIAAAGSSLVYVVLGGDEKDTIINAGLIGGAINLFGGTNLVTNTGSIGHNTLGEAIVGGMGADTVTNAAGKLIDGGISLGDGPGANGLTNSGTIGETGGLGSYSYYGGNGVDTVTNTSTGLMKATINLRDGATNTFTNAGQVFGGVLSGSGKDTLTNSGFIGQGVFLGADNDTISNFVGLVHGRIAGLINLGDGADTLTGGNNVEVVVDGNGADTTNLSGGNDYYIGTGSSGSDGRDTIDGGAGIDTYDASAASTLVQINIDTVQHTAPAGISAPTFNALVAAKTAASTDISGAFTDVVSNFENIEGSNFSGGDVLYGSSVGNVINGNGGDDDIFGFGGNDTLNGGSGNDSIWGELGKDILSGGADGDYFVYTSTSESTTIARDIIKDFSNAEGDKIDLQAIDANTANGANTNEAFHLIGTNVAWSANDPGALRVLWTALGQILEGDVNGDGKADFAIEFTNDASHSIDFTTGIIL